MHRVTVIETVERDYLVEDAGGAEAEQSARDRLHLFFRDPELFSGNTIVQRVEGETVNHRRIKAAERLPEEAPAMEPLVEE